PSGRRFVQPGGAGRPLGGRVAARVARALGAGLCVARPPPPSDIMSRAGYGMRGVAIVLTAVTAFLLVYVAYAHVASWSGRGERELLTYTQLLRSEASLAERFETRGRGALQTSFEGGVLRVAGSSGDDAAHPADRRFVGPAQRLDDRVRVALRFRARTPG